MPSVLAWLDYSADDQRRAREIVQLFSQQESRDELGIGTVRDALSDRLFPGVSTIQTRARYFLFVPWLFMEGVRKGKTGPALLAWVDWRERQLIEVLRASGAVDGLIGRVAGKQLKILPSTIYWNSLQRFGILAPGTMEQVAARNSGGQGIEDALTETVERAERTWDLNMPAAPPRFPNADEVTFDLTSAEADWLAERIIETTEGSLLAWLMRQRIDPLADSAGPWDEPAVRHDAPERLRVAVDHAERFSAVMHGAALLYNLLLARRCGEIGIPEAEKDVDGFTADLDDWAADIDRRTGELRGWDRDEFWQMIAVQNPRISPLTHHFVETWVALALSGRAASVAADSDMCRVVSDRERQQKKAQSRLVNDRLLRQWGGGSGIDPLTYRWAQVRRLLTDVTAPRRTDAGA
ncbi:MAG: DUF6361 family protein [Actinomycetota bacterium]|nr:DUF6361 family protein [Actinomycetota bacterium]